MSRDLKKMARDGGSSPNLRWNSVQAWCSPLGVPVSWGQCGV